MLGCRAAACRSGASACRDAALRRRPCPLRRETGVRRPQGGCCTDAQLRARCSCETTRQGRGRGQGGESADREPGIVIKPWQPDMPYLKDFQAAKGKGDLFAVYMKNRAKYGTSPAFFLDCADFFREAGDGELALQVLSNIAELELEDATLLRVLAYRLLQIGQLDLAVADLRAGAGTAARGAAIVPRPGPGAGPPGRQSAQRSGRVDSAAGSVRPRDYARAIDLLDPGGDAAAGTPASRRSRSSPWRRSTASSPGPRRPASRTFRSTRG